MNETYKVLIPFAIRSYRYKISDVIKLDELSDEERAILVGNGYVMPNEKTIETTMVQPSINTAITTPPGVTDSEMKDGSNKSSGEGNIKPEQNK